MKNMYNTYRQQHSQTPSIYFSGSNSHIDTSLYKDAYAQSGSGFSKGSNGLDVAQQYTPLPEEYTIFSNLDVSIFKSATTGQEHLISMFLQQMKIRLIELSQNGTVRILPKLIATTDQDDAIILNWIGANFRIYFSFEKIAENSYYGIITQDHIGNISTTAGKLNEGNYVPVIEYVLSYVINNS